jgi:hypothetical protein
MHIKISQHEPLWWAVFFDGLELAILLTILGSLDMVVGVIIGIVSSAISIGSRRNNLQIPAKAKFSIREFWIPMVGSSVAIFFGLVVGFHGLFTMPRSIAIYGSIAASLLGLLAFIRTGRIVFGNFHSRNRI